MYVLFIRELRNIDSIMQVFIGNPTAAGREIAFYPEITAKYRYQPGKIYGKYAHFGEPYRQLKSFAFEP